MSEKHPFKVKASDLWNEFIVGFDCGLCCNSGMVTVTNRFDGTTSRRPCICPNGRAMKEHERQKEHIFENRPKDPLPTNKKPDVEGAIGVAIQYGSIDGSHHKMWVIDQMVRRLAGTDYEDLVKGIKEGEDGPDTYDWDEGIAP